MNESNVNKLTVSTSEAGMTVGPRVDTPLELALGRFSEIGSNEAYSWLDRRRLYRLEARAILESHKQKVEAAGRTETKKIAVQEDVAIHALARYREEYLLWIRKDFMSMMANLGAKVMADRLTFLTDFGTKLTRFEKDLQQQDINDRFRQIILREVDVTFDQMHQKLADLTAELIESARDKEER